MAGAGSLARQLTVASAGLTSEALRLKLAQTARAALADVLESGEGSPDYVCVVNGRVGASEESVALPGPILYKFSWLQDVAAYALAFLRARWNAQGPQKGGHYRDSHFVLADGVEVRPEAIGNAHEIIVTNDQPYARKAQVGAKGFTVPKGIYEDCRQALYRRFGRALLKINVRFISLDGGYVMKGSRHPAKGAKPRKGAAKGQPLTYPALVIRMGGDA